LFRGHEVPFLKMDKRGMPATCNALPVLSTGQGNAYYAH
jgi:hypothetical protein